MAVNVCVNTSGPVLSFLLYENVNSVSNQEGFLLGEVVNKETNTISDFQMNGKETATLISVHSIIPVPNKYAFYNNIGKVDGNKLKEIVKDKSKDIIGWYRFRRNSSLAPHLTDGVIHQQLSEMLSESKKELFVTCILSSSKSSNQSTHRYNHVFYIRRRRVFEAIPFSVENLGDTSISGYKLVSNTSCSSESFQSIVSSLGQEKFSEAHLVLNMQILIKMHLQKLVNDLTESESKVSSLQKEVNLLKSQLKSGKVSNEVLLPQLLSLPVEVTAENTSEAKSVATLNNQPSALRTEATVDSEIEDKLNGKEEQVIVGDVCPENDVKDHDSSISPSPNKSSSDPFDFVTELKLKMTPPPAGRRHIGTSGDFSSAKGNSASGVTGSKRKQSARGNPSSPSPVSVPSVGDSSASKSPINRHQRSSPQRSVRKISAPENQRQQKSKQNSANRSIAPTNNSSNEN
ncbi:BRISC complex subunit Abraxas 2-like isoform X2 [Ischnura elegans]|uniref:BRISC complex subunit Abraxas 2-like isoform X2 n=1 Tax=Ischnura elegans TaxID=197161 RepID=UPI001ED8A02B|nr:BRISC complex subunit Abraxas 2-like isoform X2 [Ischnura elegans]